MASSESSQERPRNESEDVEMKSAEEEVSGDEGLFGSGSERSGGGAGRSPGASDVDMNGRNSEEGSAQPEERTVFEVDVAHHPIPKGDDGETYILKMPAFLSIEPQIFTNHNFQPPTTDHHQKTARPSFSPYDRAMETIRWRYNPENPKEIQSNAKINTWSDGSKTLQLGNNPSEQYELVPKSLAPVPGSKNGYDVNKDSLIYVTVPHMAAGLLGVTNHVTTQLNVLPNKTANDEALIKLQEGLAAAVNRGEADGGIRFIELKEDPELEKKRVEAAEKEKLKAQKRREAAAERDRERASRTLNRGVRSRGLTVGMLEDEEDNTGPSPRKRAGPAKRAPRQRRDDYDTDDEGPRGRTREDEYDKGDDFLVDSDEEPEIYEEEDLDAEGEDDEHMEDSDNDKRTSAKPSGKSGAESGSNKPSKRTEAPSQEAAPGRNRRRRFVEDDDDEE